MSSRCTSSPIHRQIFPDSRKRIDLRGDEDRQAELPHHLESIRAIGGDSDRRVGLLHRFGNHRNLSNLEEAATMGNSFVSPGLADYLEGFQESITAFGLRHAEPFEVLGQRATADAELHSAVTQHIKGRNLFRYSHRM